VTIARASGFIILDEATPMCLIDVFPSCSLEMRISAGRKACCPLHPAPSDGRFRRGGFFESRSLRGRTLR